jgi:AraC-like DNA-binding protein
MINFFISGGSLVFLFFAVYSISNKQGNQLINKLLGLAFFIQFIQTAMFVFTQNGDIDALYWALPLNSVMQLLFPVFLYLYFYCFTNDKTSLSPIHFIHFLPGVLFSFDTLSWFATDKQGVLLFLNDVIESKQFLSTNPFSFVPETLQHPIRRGVGMLYTSVIWYTIIKGFAGQSWNIQKKWVFFLATILTFNQVLQTVQYVILVKNTMQLSAVPVGDLTLTPIHIIIMIVLLFVLFYEPRLLYGHILISDKWKNNRDAAVHPVISDTTKPEETPKKAPIDEERVELYLEVMIGLMDKKKPYLNPEYQISNLSSDLGIPVHHCSYVLNYHMGKGFRDWVNGYRVKYFLQQLPLKRGTKTIEAIAMESGFKNVTTFYNTFKKETGQLPKEHTKERL